MKIILSVLLLALPVMGEDFYVSQSGGGNGSSSGSPTNVAWFNSSANWGAGTGKISAGDTVHLVGTFNNGGKLTIQGSGSAGNPITVLFEPGAKFSDTHYTGLVGNSPGAIVGVITIINKSYITIDGQGGLIECTDNGNGKSFQSSTVGIGGYSSDNITIKNIAMPNLYTRAAGQTSTATAMGIDFFPMGSFLTFSNVYVSYVENAVGCYYYNSGGNPTHPHDLVIQSVTSSNQARALDIRSGGPNNTLTNLTIDRVVQANTLTWDQPDNAYHAEFMHLTASHDGSVLSTIRISNCRCYGPWSTHTTGTIYTEDEASNGLVYDLIAWNNMIESNWEGCYHKGPLTPDATKHHIFVNNTIWGSGNAFYSYYGPSDIYYNNVVVPGVGTLYYGSGGGTATPVFDYCCAYNIGNMISGSASGSFGSHSTTSNPQLDSSYAPTASSAAIVGTGSNLTAWLSATAPGITKDINGNSRPASGGWTMGAVEYNAGGGGGGPVTYYASPTGSSANNGLTTSTPWPLAYAINHVGNSNTIIVMDGNYTWSDNVQGTVTNSWVSIQAQNKWKARIVDSPNRGIAVLNSGIIAQGLTLDGLDISNAQKNCVLLWSGTNHTVRNCWLHKAGGIAGGGQGDCNGLNCFPSANCLFERNLVEYNGNHANFDHGIYFGGTNIVVRNNVIRYNNALGINGYDGTPGDVHLCQIYGNLIYSNVTGGVRTSGDMVIYAGYAEGSGAGKTNWIYGNTFLSPVQWAMQLYLGQFFVTNNIIVSTSDGFDHTLGTGGNIYADYNLAPSTLFVAGAHDLTTATPGFVNPGTGLYWLTSGAAARNAALAGAHGAVDFFGNALSSVADIGAFQYSASYAVDPRALDPSPGGGADYWALLTNTPPSITQQPTGQTNYVGDTVSLSVMVAGAPTLAYQWRQNTNAITGATSATYTSNNVQYAQRGWYDVVVTNNYGAVTSTAVYLSLSTNLNLAPAVAAQWTNAAVNASSTDTSITVAGLNRLLVVFIEGWDLANQNVTNVFYNTSEALTLYARTNWYDSFGDFDVWYLGNPSVATANLTIQGNAIDDLATQIVLVTNAAGSSPLEAVAMSFVGTSSSPNTSTGDTLNPVSSTNELVLDAVVSGLQTFTPNGAQTLLNRIAVSTNTKLQASRRTSLSGSTPMTWTGTADQMSHIAVAVKGVTGTGPSITTQPVGWTNSTAYPLWFTVTAAGDAPLAYQWRADGSAIGGATASAYTNTTPTAGTAQYDVVITNSFGTATSSGVYGTITNPPAAPQSIVIIQGPSSVQAGSVR